MPLFNFFKKPAKPVPIVVHPAPPVKRCELYNDFGASTRSLFDDNFPSESTLKANTSSNVHGVRTGFNTTITCHQDHSVTAEIANEIGPVHGARMSGGLTAKPDKTRKVLTGEVAGLAALPGFGGLVAVSDKQEMFRARTSYQHPWFGVSADMGWHESHEATLCLSTTACHRAAGLMAGISAKGFVKRAKDEAGNLSDVKIVGIKTVDFRAGMARGPWNVFVEGTEAGTLYTLTASRDMTTDHLGEMLIGARLSAHAARPDLSDAVTARQKLTAVRAALQPVLTVGMQKRLSQKVVAKAKADTTGLLCFSLSEQLSDMLQAVFALNVDAVNIKPQGRSTFAFTLTISN